MTHAHARPALRQARASIATSRRRPLSGTLPALGLLAFLGGCADSTKAANKDNFTRAIHAYEQAHPEQTRVCSTINTGVSAASTAYYPSIRTSPSFTSWEGLSKLGYLTIKPTRAKSFLDTVDAIEVAVTPKYIQDFGQPSEGRSDVCVGSFKLDHINDFSEPADVNSVRASAVEATVRQTVTAAWAKDARLAPLIDFQAPPAERKVRYVLVLNNSGWVVNSLIRR